MKLSVEAKVAAAVAAGFIGLTAAAIGQGGSDVKNLGPAPEKNSEIPAHVSEQRYSSSPHRTNTGQDSYTSPGDGAPTASARNDTKTKVGKSQKHHSREPSTRNEAMQTKRPVY